MKDLHLIESMEQFLGTDDSIFKRSMVHDKIKFHDAIVIINYH